MESPQCVLCEATSLGRAEMKFIAMVLLITASISYAVEKRRENVFKTFHLSEEQLGVRCTNGAIPDAQKVANTFVIVSCEKQ